MIARVVGGRRRRSAAAVVLLAGAFVTTPARSQDEGACRITGGYGAVFHDLALGDGTFGFRGVIILRTRSCGDGPKGVSGSFHPVGGVSATCTPVETPRLDESRCAFEGSAGLGAPGMPVVIVATAHTSGVFSDHVHDDDTLEGIQRSRIQPGAEVKTSECVVELPEDGGRSACTLF